MLGRVLGGVEVPMGLGLKGLKHKEEKNERVLDPEGGPLGTRGPKSHLFQTQRSAPSVGLFWIFLRWGVLPFRVTTKVYFQCFLIPKESVSRKD